MLNGASGPLWRDCYRETQSRAGPLRVHSGPLGSTCLSLLWGRPVRFESTRVHFVGNLIKKLNWNHFEPMYDSLQLSGLKLFWPCLSLLATMVKKPQREECVSAIGTENQMSFEFLVCLTLTGYKISWHLFLGIDTMGKVMYFLNVGSNWQKR